MKPTIVSLEFNHKIKINAPLERVWEVLKKFRPAEVTNSYQKGTNVRTEFITEDGLEGISVKTLVEEIPYKLLVIKAKTVVDNISSITSLTRHEIDEVDAGSIQWKMVQHLIHSGEDPTSSIQAYYNSKMKKLMRNVKKDAEHRFDN